MEFTENNKDELFNDLTEVTFIPGEISGNYKYEARVPMNIWNKWRSDKPLTRNEYRVVKFGSPEYQHYKDLIGDWSQFDHNDKKRRKAYRARHEPIKINIEGRNYRSFMVPFTPEFFSYWFLW